jgi:hypothetical protein
VDAVRPVPGQRPADAFDNLSIDYASTFETSPPSWRAPAAAAPGWAGLTPTESFSGVLGPHIAPQLERLRALAGQPGAAAGIQPRDGGQRRRRGAAAGHPAPAATAAARADPGRRGRPHRAAARGLAIGRRDEGEAVWLLLLELLQLQNREKEFEQISMDYCVTFEVSPPSFTPPHKVAMAPAQPPASPDRFMLPPIIEQQLALCCRPSSSMLSSIRRWCSTARA